MKDEPPISSPAALTIFVLIVRTERAHDESHCAFTRRSERRLDGVRVLEDARSCLPELEERRYQVERAPAVPFELARKRLPRTQFAADRYRWTLRQDQAHKLVLRIEIDGKLSSEFFEQDVSR
jgi:hypothetical protein